MKSAGRERPDPANHDTAVAPSPSFSPTLSSQSWLPMVLIGALIAAAPSCAAPAQAVDAPSVPRVDPLDPDAETDAEIPDPAPVLATRAAGPLEWISSESQGAEQSKAERRPMLVSFATEWCGVCKRLVKETFGDPRVKARAGRFIAVRIDATNDDDPQVNAALLKYAVIGLPTLVVLDSTGHEQRRFTDFVPPDALLAEIDLVR